jgi:hypothetical protein
MFARTAPFMSATGTPRPGLLTLISICHQSACAWWTMLARGAKSAKVTDMNLHRRLVALGSFALLLGCSNDANDSRQKPASPPDIGSVVYAGGTTDEALLRLLDITAKDDARQYVIVDAPDLSEPLPSDPPAAFEFHLASEATHVPTPRAAPVPRPAWRRALGEVLQLLGPPRVAHAHGVPYNGTAYYLVVRDADSKPLLQVFTGKASYTPAADAWQKLTEAKPPLTLDITSAFFEANDIPADGGPFVGGEFEFTIE